MLEEDRYDSQPLLSSMPMPSNKLEIIPTDMYIIEIELIYNMYKNSIISFYESMTELHGCIKTRIDIDFSMNHALDNISSNEVIKHMFSHTNPYIVDATNFETAAPPAQKVHLSILPLEPKPTCGNCGAPNGHA